MPGLKKNSALWIAGRSGCGGVGVGWRWGAGGPGPVGRGSLYCMGVAHPWAAAACPCHTCSACPPPGLPMLPQPASPSYHRNACMQLLTIPVVDAVGGWEGVVGGAWLILVIQCIKPQTLNSPPLRRVNPTPPP